jgi:Type VI secretion system/phage-baseplate injector OB domain
VSDERHYGKYRGKVVANSDPQRLGRIQVNCPAVLGDGNLSWALPCSPYAGPGVGFFAVPPVGADVWVEFEGGDPDYPICAGCFWSSGQVPVATAAASTKMLKTDGLTLTVDDRQGSGGVTLEVSSPVVSNPLKIELTSNGIVLSNGNASVKLDPVSVSLNDGALKVI